MSGRQNELKDSNAIVFNESQNAACSVHRDVRRPYAKSNLNKGTNAVDLKGLIGKSLPRKKRLTGPIPAKPASSSPGHSPIEL